MIEVVVIGGGIAGLSAAYRLQGGEASGRVPEYRLVEGDGRWGGKILSERVDGFLVEGGPDSFIPQKPEALALVKDLGLSDRLMPSNDARRGAFVVRGGRMLPLPEGFTMLMPSQWGPFLRSPILSWPAKVRVATERWVPPRESGEEDESVADFVRRRMGREALERLGEPLLAHIHVADIERMSLRATYPQLARLEDRSGSLTRGLREMRSRRANPPSPMFWSLRGGLGELVDALVGRLDPHHLILGHRASSLERMEDGYRVRLENGTSLETRSVILALPARSAANLVRGLDEDLASRMAAIRDVSMATVSFGFRRRELGRSLDGFGFFVPRHEKRRILACTWTSTKFDHRAPSEMELVRVFLGGAHGQEDLELDDDQLLSEVLQELRQLLGVTAEPCLSRLYRWPRGYPQYDVGHPSRLREIEESLPPGIHLAGSAFHGVGLPDCIRSASRAAENALDQIVRARG